MGEAETAQRRSAPTDAPTDAPADAPVGGLRELKKQRTRAKIADAAMELFLARGFDAVPVAEIARSAEVSEATLFNYFRAKEDLVYGSLDAFWDRLIDAVEHRADDQGVLDALEDFLVGQEPSALAADEQGRIAAIHRLIAASPALLARERASYDEAATRLAEVIARTTAAGDDAAAAAQLVLGIHRSLVAFTRDRLSAGTGGATLARDTAARTRSAFALLRTGLTI